MEDVSLVSLFLVERPAALISSSTGPLVNQRMIEELTFSSVGAQRSSSSTEVETVKFGLSKQGGEIIREVWLAC